MKKWIIATLIVGIVCFIVASKGTEKAQKVADKNNSIYNEVLSELGQ
jgi:hypothetical protein